MIFTQQALLDSWDSYQQNFLLCILIFIAFLSEEVPLSKSRDALFFLLPLWLSEWTMNHFITKDLLASTFVSYHVLIIHLLSLSTWTNSLDNTIHSTNFFFFPLLLLAFPNTNMGMSFSTLLKNTINPLNHINQPHLLAFKYPSFSSNLPPQAIKYVSLYLNHLTVVK